MSAIGELKPSLWDTAPFLRSQNFDTTTFTSLPAAKRLEQRTRCFERAHKGADSGIVRVAGEEYTRRVNRFREYTDDVALTVSHSPWPGARSRMSPMSKWALWMAIILLPGLVFGLWLLAGSGWLIVPLLLLLPTLRTFRGWRTSMAFDRALNEDRCADCGYLLAGVPPGVAVEMAGVNVGPRVCPECGASWPLVPVGV